MKRILWITSCLLTLLNCNLFSQGYTQTIRGKIIDQEAKSGMPGAVVVLMKDTINLQNTITDDNGNFRFDNLPIGKYGLRVHFTGYNELLLRDLILNSGKETVLNLEMEEKALQIKEAVVLATKKGEVRNEMALVSTRTFDAQETERYPGSRQDPARMASNFAGVSGNDDSRNDIVIRGNSPQGLLFRVEGVDLYNANHFALPGATGGPVSMLNNKTIGASDFMTGAFPAEYGNATAGVFDIHLRTGNTEKYESTVQVGLLGLEAASEGPISRKNNSSYIIAYRYSTLSLAHNMGVDIGTSSIPVYQDITFKLNFPMGKNDAVSVFGIGGTSNVSIIMSKYNKPTRELYGAADQDIYDSFKNGLIGASWGHTLSSSAYMKFTIAGTYYQGNFTNSRIGRRPDFSIDTTYTRAHASYMDERTVFSWFLNKKLNSRNIFKFGVNATSIYTSILDHRMDEDSTYKWKSRASVSTTNFLFQPYIQYKFRLNEKVDFTAGIHGQYYTLSKAKSIEPRASFKWRLSEKSSISLGGGMHSNMLPVTIGYIHQPTAGNTESYNNKLDFMRSNHAVISFDHSISSDLRIKVESYYQKLYNVPVNRYKSSFSALNEGSTYSLFSFAYDTLVNKGTGQNYGLELTVEKFFTHHYFLLATGTLFNSTYIGSDGVQRSTSFNGKFITNLLGGKEFMIGKNALTFSGKVSWAGGKLYSPADINASQKVKDFVPNNNERNSKQFPDYFRLDCKIGYKINTKKFTHEIAIDLVNVTGYKNVSDFTYADDPRYKPNDMIQIQKEYQLGFLPLFYYKVDF